MKVNGTVVAVALGAAVLWYSARKAGDAAGAVVESVENTYAGARLSLSDWFARLSGLEARERAIMNDPDYARIVNRLE
ncbi:MAG: hypothetical protein CME39_09715 [Haliea sp.]|nr:hypothetical protein [Haliea sp.]